MHNNTDFHDNREAFACFLTPIASNFIRELRTAAAITGESDEIARRIENELELQLENIFLSGWAKAFSGTFDGSLILNTLDLASMLLDVEKIASLTESLANTILSRNGIALEPNLEEKLADIMTPPARSIASEATRFVQDAPYPEAAKLRICSFIDEHFTRLFLESVTRDIVAARGRKATTARLSLNFVLIICVSHVASQMFRGQWHTLSTRELVMVISSGVQPVRSASKQQGENDAVQW